MKILAFTDIHGDVEAIKEITKKSNECDLLICSGDLTIFGNDQKKLLDKLDAINKPIIMLHGNHENAKTLEKMCDDTKNIKYAHNEAIEINNITIIIHGGGGFSLRYPDFDATTLQFKNLMKHSEKTIAVFHAPPHNTALDDINNGLEGSKSYREFIEDTQPDICICGHFHERFNKEDKLGKTVIINPGPLGKIINL